MGFYARCFLGSFVMDFVAPVCLEPPWCFTGSMSAGIWFQGGLVSSYYHDFLCCCCYSALQLYGVFYFCCCAQQVIILGWLGSARLLASSSFQCVSLQSLLFCYPYIYREAVCLGCPAGHDSFCFCYRAAIAVLLQRVLLAICTSFR